jgi:hypothetical protein
LQFVRQEAENATQVAGTVAGTPALIGFSYDGAVVVQYVNGASIGQDNMTATVIDNSNEVTIGNQASGDADFLNGAISSVAIWSRALSVGEWGLLFTAYTLQRGLADNPPPFIAGRGAC